VRTGAWLLTLLGLAACSVGDKAKTIDDTRRDKLVLQRADVPRDLRPIYMRSLADRPVSTVRFARAGRALSIESTVHVLESRDAAEERLEADRDAVDRKPDWQPIDEPGLGDESFAATVRQAGLRRYEVFWREHNAAASLKVEEFEGKMALADVLALARKQERRIADAAD
jgi:hypothetical protein